MDKIKEIIGTKKFDDINILINTDDNLPGDITLKNVILITCILKDDDKFPLQLRRSIVWRIIREIACHEKIY